MIKKISLLLLVFSLFNPIAKTLAFEDTVDHRYEEAIAFAQEEGIVSGYPDGTYQPDRILNRAELLKIIIEAAYEDEFEDYGSDGCYGDVPADEWYTSYICFATEQGIVEGYPDGSFKPASEVNFVEALKMALLGFGESIQTTNSYVWYADYVKKAAERNMIPLDIKTFDQSLSRAQMAELMTRYLKENRGELLNYLEADYDLIVNYTTLVYELDVESLRTFNEDFLTLLNNYREENGLSALIMDANLNEAALLHSRWMNETGTLSHTGDGGSEYYERCADAGSFCISENAAYNGLPSAENFFESWRQSPGHNANMLLNGIEAIGIGLSGSYATTDFR